MPRTGSYELTLRTSARRRVAAASVVYEIANEVAGHPDATGVIAARRSDGERTLTFRVPASLRRSPRLESALLVVSNGDPLGRVSYAVTAR